MYGDTLIFEQHQHNKAGLIYNKIEGLKKPLVMSIYGISGTSKSEIAYLLQQELIKNKISSYCLSIDDYYITHPLERNAYRKLTDKIGHVEINWGKLNRVIKDFKKRRKSWVQEYYLFYENLRHMRINFNKVDVLIIEGIYAGYVNSDYYVYLNGNLNDTYKFRKKRAKENPDDKFRQKVLSIEEIEVISTKHKANMKISYE